MADANASPPREAALVRSDRDARLILEVEVEVDADPIAGVVRRDPHSPGDAFIGWMGLTRAIELALERRNGEEGSP